MDHYLIKVNHLKHCMKYKKTVFRCIFPYLPFSEEIEKYLFTFVGVFPLYSDALSYTAVSPVLLPSPTSFPLHTSLVDLSPNTDDDLSVFVS